MLIDMYMSGDNKPIGWWLKEVDRLLEASFEQLLAADGLNRRQWQALNAAAGPEPIASGLRPFLTGDPAEITEITDPLAERGWLKDDQLTAEGEAAVETLTTKVQAQRRRLMNGVADEEYLTTLAVLRRMARNLTN